LSAFFEEILAKGGERDPQSAGNWVINDVLGLQRARELPVDQFPVTAQQVVDMISAVAAGKITHRAGRELLPLLAAQESVLGAAEKHGLIALDDTEAIRTAVRETLAAFPAAVSDYQSGKQAAIGRLIGETIRRTGGRANPDIVRSILLQELGVN
ncbi:MAG TPA: hypothetical protein PK691_10790, partial [Thermomicrobiales bacterium]|nr:hypothetical protein [Thermomicrobiales bacterium]